MRVIRAEEVAPGPGAVRFRPSPWPATLASLLPAAVLAGVWPLGLVGALPWLVVGLAGGFAAVMLVVGLAMLRRALDPDAWLLACDGSRVLIRLRSYLNARPGDGGMAIELPVADLEAAREARLHVRGRDAQAERHDRRSAFLELELRHGTEADVAVLADHLREERRRRAGGFTWRHYPVTLVGERTVRIEWRSSHTRITPGIEEALRLLGPGVRVDAGASSAIDLGGEGRAPSGESALEGIRALAEQGRVMEAVLLARRALGLDATQAKALIERLAEGTATDGEPDRA